METTQTVEIKVKIEGLYQKGYDAYRGISFDPEKRAARIVKDFEQELNEDLLKIPADQHERYIQNYKGYLFAWLAAHARLVSPMISGPSNFPSARMKKYGNWERSASDRFTDWRKRALNAIAKQIEKQKTPEERRDEKWISLEKSIRESAAVVMNYDKGIDTRWSRRLFVNSITGLVERVAADGDKVNVQRMLKLIRALNEQATKPIVSATHKMWNMETVAEAAAESKEDFSKKESEEFPFTGGKVIYNYQMDRMQLCFDERQSKERCHELSKNGFKWSPSQKVWQRYLTANSKFATQRLLNIELPNRNLR